MKREKWSAFDPELTKGDHTIGLLVPNFQAKAAPNFDGVPGGCANVLQFRHTFHAFTQAIKRDAGIDVVNVMIADVGREPVHHGAHFHEARRRQCGVGIGPVVVLAEFGVGEVVLTIEEVSAER